MSCDLNGKQRHCDEIKSLNAKLTGMEVIVTYWP